MLLLGFSTEIFLSLVLFFQLYYFLSSAASYRINFRQKNIGQQTAFILIICLILLFISNTYFYINEDLLYTNENTQNLKIFLVLISLLLIPFIKEFLKCTKIYFIEFETIFLFTVLTSLLLVSANNLIIVYLLVELLSLCFYILSSYERESTFSVEGGIKYFIFSAVGSSFFLLGVAIMYGLTGTLNFQDLGDLNYFAIPERLDFFMKLSIILMFFFFLIKLGLFPFHFWFVDIYDGVPLISAMLFSLLSKPIFINLFMKWSLFLGTSFFYLSNLICIVSFISIIISVLNSTDQVSLKRFFVYSGISNISMIFLCSAYRLLETNAASYYFIIIYTLSGFISWGSMIMLTVFYKNFQSFFKKTTYQFYIVDLNSFFYYNTIFSFIFTILFFSLAGIPFFLGFFSKVFIFLKLFNFESVLFLGLVLIISSISAYYYIRIIKIIFFEYKKKNSKLQIFIFDKNMQLSAYIIVFCVLMLLSFIEDQWLLIYFSFDLSFF